MTELTDAIDGVTKYGSDAILSAAATIAKMREGRVVADVPEQERGLDCAAVWRWTDGPRLSRQGPVSIGRYAMSRSTAKCPIGMESAHWLCSAGTCAVCLDDLRKQVGTRDADLIRLREEVRALTLERDKMRERAHEIVRKAHAEYQAALAVASTYEAWEISVREAEIGRLRDGLAAAERDLVRVLREGGVTAVASGQIGDCLAKVREAMK